MSAYLRGCAMGAGVRRHKAQAHRTSPLFRGEGALGAPMISESHPKRCVVGAGLGGGLS